MNIRAKTIFDNIGILASAYSRKVSFILANYENEMEKVQSDAGKFNEDYKKEFIAEKQKSLAGKAKHDLAEAADDFREKTLKDAEALRNQLDDVLCKPVSIALMNHLNVYNQFGIVPSRSQITALLTLNEGNQLGLQAIKSMLSKNHSPLTINFPGVKQFEDDIDVVEKLAYAADHHVPYDHFHAGCEVYKNDRVTYRRADGSTYENGQVWDKIELTTQNVKMKTLVDAVGKMGDAWLDAVTSATIDAASEEYLKEEREKAYVNGEEAPTLPDVPPTTTVEKTNDDAVELAGSIGRETAACNAASLKGSKYEK